MELKPELRSKPGKAAAMLVGATTAWGASFLVMKALGQKQQQMIPGLGTWFMSSLSLLIRFGGSAVIMALCNVRNLWRITRLEWRHGLGLGIFGGLGLLVQQDGVMYTSASTAAFLNQGYCIFIPLILVFHRRALPSKFLAASCAMVVAGVAILSNINWAQLRLGRGEAESLFSSVLFTGQILWLERPVFQRNRSGVVTVIMFVTVALIVLPVAVLTSHGPREWIAAYSSWPTVALVAFLTLICTVVAYGIMNYWQPHIPATEAGLIYCCEPVFTSIFALFLPAMLSAAAGINYPNEMLNNRLLLGGGLITAANVLIIWQTTRANPLPSPPRPAADHAR